MSMHRFARRRPSPALIVACLALFVALGGTSYAVAVGSIGTREIRDSSVRGIDVKNRSLAGRDLGNDSIGGGAIKEETLDVSKLDLPDLRAADGLASHVMVKGDGGRFHTRGVETVQHTDTGRYVVVFDRDVSECVPAATLVAFTNANPGQSGASGTIAVRPDGSRPNAIEVQTGNDAGADADADFYLLVSC